jgi:D-ribose pyranose/furanose isomerase RbsD
MEKSSVIFRMGRLDMITIAHAGLAVPSSVPRIDLALKQGAPGFTETLAVILGDLLMERECTRYADIILASGAWGFWQDAVHIKDIFEEPSR